MYLPDVKRLIVKSLHILKTQDQMKNDVSSYDDDWKTLIDNLRTDPATRNSWYLL